MRILQVDCSKLSPQRQRRYDRKCILFNSKKGLTKWKSKLNAIKNGTNNILNIAYVGDSIGEGFQNGANLSTLQANAAKWKLTTYFNTIFDDCGWGYIPEHYPSAGAGPLIITYTGTWATTNYNFVRKAKSTNTNGSYLEFSFNGTGCEIWTRQNTSQTSSILVEVDGGAAVEYNLRVAPTTFPKRLTIATGLENTTHTVKITNNAAQTFAFMGIMEHKGSRGVRVHLMSKSGAIAGNISDPTTSQTCWVGLSAAGMVPDLTIYNIGANDYLQPTTLSTFETNVNQDLSMLKNLGCDIIIGTDGCLDIAGYPYSWDGYVSILKRIAKKYNCCFVHHTRDWGSVGGARSNGYLSTNASDPHPTIAGHLSMYNRYISLIG